jgi:hypothetical protein
VRFLIAAERSKATQGAFVLFVAKESTWVENPPYILRETL